jgi:pimeloyl-ACP methyl ester carboxylesterase
MFLACSLEGTGPTVVLLHGFPLDRSLWTEQFQALKSTYRVVAPDLRGHGSSPVASRVSTVQEMAQDVLDSLEGLKVVGPFVVGGLSMGGYVALALAIEHADRVRALMLLNSRAAADTEQARAGREDLARKVEKAKDVGAVVESMLPKLFAPGRAPQRDPIVERVEAMMRRSSSEGVAATLRGLAARPDRTADLPGIRVPTLVLAGARDQIVPLDESRSMAAAMSGARLVVVEGAGHLAPVERPDEVNSAILDFLASLPAIS